MLLCSILRGALSASFGTVVQITIFLLQNSNISRVLASMPPGAEDEVILIEHLPGRRVHLQDFFWTGLEDAPPWVDPNQGLTYYETRTIVHTVTVYTPTDEKGPQDPISPHRPDTYNPECVTCIEPTPRLDDDEDQSIGVLIGDDPGPRYWLLTVLRPGEAVPPKVELRLARLYRAAFSRQQQRHLGLLSTDPRSRRDALLRGLINRKNIQERLGTSSQVRAPREEIPANTTEAQPSELTVGTIGNFSTRAGTEASVPSLQLVDNKYFSNVSQVKSMRMIEIPRPKKMLLPTFDIDATTDNNEKTAKDDFALKKIIKTLKGETKSLSIQNDESITVDPTHLGPDRVDDSGKQSPPELVPKLNTDSISGSRSNDNKNASANIRSRSRFADGSIPGVVKVRMQNTSVIEGGATRLIYSVHLDDKPVPAETAARDMALLSPQEVALELGAPVIIQSEPYLKESRPLALSRRRDAWLLIGAAGAGVVLLILVLTGLILAAKRKRAHSAVVAPPNKSILKKEREYAATTSGLDNAAFSTSETEVKTDGTSQRQTPRTLSRTPITPDTPDSLELGIHEVSSDDDEEPRKTRGSAPWGTQEHAVKKARASHGRMARANAMDRAGSPDSLTDHVETLESLENGYVKHKEESTASPRSYLSMPSCKQFPSMRSVEPLSRVLEPVMVRHLDIDSPELVRHDRDDNIDDTFLARTSSASKDPGAVGPIVWNLSKQIFSTEDSTTLKVMVHPKRISMECTVYHPDPWAAPGGDSTSCSRTPSASSEAETSRSKSRNDRRSRRSPSHVQRTHSRYSRRPEANPPTSGTYPSSSSTSSSNSPVATPTMEMKTRPRTSLPRRGLDEDIPETGQTESIHSRGAWGSRPLSAGPFHRPNLPEVDTRRILADSRLPPEDPAVPLIASIKKELEKFSPQ
ncbi:uncharacterized protein LOC112466610 isoform X1 [Temnothorax curvispinosus]|uniref:Uncharacterized protein LOC112466610 isoform X1 n=1 Tax=Temnothorax curvispinosus TaxID=300111 RepID=A0A6J1RCQ5_9HYME|nr:uncharacterized protein LOC112466610 isoform X1 [Temnothorax curvispinosus]